VGGPVEYDPLAPGNISYLLWMSDPERCVPPDQRGFALGINQVSGLSGMFIGLVAGGLLAAWDWRAVFWVNVPVGVFGTVWAYRKLRDNGERHGGRIDWWGNITFAIGLGAVLIALTNGIQPYARRRCGLATSCCP
jgi:predicted MFS family arabinose efflux permease